MNDKRADGGGALDEFIDSKAMITPGLAGTTVIMITGTLVTQFGLPGNWVALIASFLFGLTVLTDKSVRQPQKSIFYVLNSLIIFTVANGINAAAIETVHADPPPIERGVDLLDEDDDGFFRRWTW